MQDQPQAITQACPCRSSGARRITQACPYRSSGARRITRACPCRPSGVPWIRPGSYPGGIQDQPGNLPSMATWQDSGSTREGSPRPVRVGRLEPTGSARAPTQHGHLAGCRISPKPSPRLARVYRLEPPSRALPVVWSHSGQDSGSTREASPRPTRVGRLESTGSARAPTQRGHLEGFRISPKPSPRPARVHRLESTRPGLTGRLESLGSLPGATQGRIQDHPGRITQACPRSPSGVHRIRPGLQYVSDMSLG